jgi:DNA-binding transcriptional LysR family regulator
MLDDLDEMRSFQRILALGSLSAAARDLGVSLAVVSKRLASLERRVGQRLIHRTTRRLSPTEEGAALLARVERVMEALDAAEAWVSEGRDGPAGTLRVSAPISLGRLHVAPVLAGLTRDHPRLEAELRLGDGLIDLMEARIDVAVRIGPARDSRQVMRKLADSHRILVASPDYLDRRGRPEAPGDLADHDGLRSMGWAPIWRLANAAGETVEITPPCRLRSDNGEAVHDWALAGLGVMLKSAIDVAADLRAGRLERVLPGWSIPDAPIYALIPSARHVASKTRLFVDALAAALKATGAAEPRLEPPQLHADPPSAEPSAAASMRDSRQNRRRAPPC